jgi:hypothetical protein
MVYYSVVELQISFWFEIVLLLYFSFSFSFICEVYCTNA